MKTSSLKTSFKGRDRKAVVESERERIQWNGSFPFDFSSCDPSSVRFPGNQVRSLPAYISATVVWLVFKAEVSRPLLPGWFSRLRSLRSNRFTFGKVITDDLAKTGQRWHKLQALLYDILAVIM